MCREFRFRPRSPDVLLAALAAAACALFLVRISSELKVLKVREQEAHCDAVADACGQRAASRENEFPG